MPRMGRWLRNLFQLVWLCRISVLSVVIGYWLLAHVAQVQDLFIELRPLPGGLVHWFVFFLCVFVFWSFPVFYCARVLLRLFSHRVDALSAPGFRSTVVWLPRVLGLLCYWCIWQGLDAAEANLSGATGLPVVDAAVSQVHFLKIGVLINAALFAAFVIWRRKLWEVTAGVFGIAPALRDDNYVPVDPQHLAAGEWIGVGLLGVSALATIGFSLADPLRVGTEWSRAVLFGIVIGAWVVPLSWLAWLAHRIRLPVIGLLALAIGLAPVLFGDTNDLRRVRAKGNPSVQRSDIDRAIASWRKVNGCSEDVSACPKPIIVAAAGGASRAAYYTLLILGQITDAAKDRVAYRSFPEQLFAISAVSGGALGATLYAAATADSTDGEPPCRSAALRSWKLCLTALASGDFLSPVFVNLAFREVFSFLRVPDRAAVLERAWERRYRELTDRLTLRQPFSALAPTDGRWRPFLLLNGTSVETGARILTSHLQPEVRTQSSITPQEPKSLFPTAFDMYQLLADQRESREPGLLGPFSSIIGRALAPRGCGGTADCDLRASTAALASARFPLISPHGAIRNEKRQIVDRVVDGGYHENYGAQTAIEIGAALRERGLKPAILLITNDPDLRIGSRPFLGPCSELSSTQQGQPKQTCVFPDAPEAVSFALFSSPVRALMGARTAQGDFTADSLVKAFDDGVDPQDYFSARVYPTLSRPTGSAPAGECTQDRNENPEAVYRVQSLSMSWWLSEVVREFLDRQQQDPCNLRTFDAILKLLQRDGARDGKDPTGQPLQR